MKKIKFRRKHTPQGFNYFVDRNSLEIYFGLGDSDSHPLDELNEHSHAIDSSDNYGSSLNLKPSHHEEKVVAKDTAKKSSLQQQPHFPQPPTHHDRVGLESIPYEELDPSPPQMPSQDTEKTLHIDSSADSVFSKPTYHQDDNTIHIDSDFQKRTPDLNQFLPEFNKTIDRLIEQYERVISQQEEDKRNLFRLVETFQERIISLENRIKQLEAPKKVKKWYHFF